MPKAAPARSVRVETKQGLPAEVVLRPGSRWDRSRRKPAGCHWSQRADRQGANSIVEEIASALAGELEACSESIGNSNVNCDFLVYIYMRPEVMKVQRRVENMTSSKAREGFQELKRANRSWFP